MAARTGEQYLQGLRERPPEVWVGGQRVADVTAHPGFANGARSVAALYDMQHDPALREELTYPSPTTGEPVGMSFIMPQNLEDLERRRRMFYRWASWHGGFMGRTPDYMNAAFVAMASAGDYFDGDRAGFGDNVRRYYELIREQDLCLTHTLVNPQRSRTPQRYITDSLAEDVALKVVKETDAGVVVRGARVLATLGPLSDEIAVYPSRSHHTADNADQYALSFSIPSNTPGLRYLCRESFRLREVAL